MHFQNAIFYILLILVFDYCRSKYVPCHEICTDRNRKAVSRDFVATPCIILKSFWSNYCNLYSLFTSMPFVFCTTPLISFAHLLPLFGTLLPSSDRTLKYCLLTTVISMEIKVHLHKVIQYITCPVPLIYLETCNYILVH